MAELLIALGHEVRVVTVRRPLASENGLPDNLPSRFVVRTPWWGERAIRAWKRTAVPGTNPMNESGSAAASTAWRTGFRSAFRRTVYTPDILVGWVPPGLVATLCRLRGWRPDVVYSSSPPTTSTILGYLFSRTLSAPHVAEFRDLWVGNPYRHVPAWANGLDATLERSILNRAAGIVTVTVSHASELARRYPTVPVTTIYNGFDPAEYGRLSAPPPEKGLRLLHAGGLLDGRRDPGPLFQVLRRLADSGRSVHLDMYGAESRALQKLVTANDCHDLVTLHDLVDRESALRAMKESDVLVLLMWLDERAKPDLSGKIFEYVGAGRTVLVWGPDGSEAGRLMDSRGLGRAVSNVDDAVTYLEGLCTAKERGEDLVTDPSVVADFTRQHQAERLSEFLTSVVRDAEDSRRR
jgi:hypothetical protein